MKLQKVQNEIKIERKKEGVIPFTASVINLPKRERERLLTSLKQLSQKEETTEIEDRGLLPDTARLCTPQAQPYANLSYANEVPCAAVSR